MAGRHDYFLVDGGSAMPRWCELVRVDGSDALGWMDTRGVVVPRDSGWPIAHVEGDGPDCTLAAPEAIAAIERALACVHLLDPWSDQGWIDPAGTFYGCRFARHENLAYALIRRTIGDLEAEGWVRVNPDSFRMSEFGTSSLKPNWRQARTLSALGFRNPRPGERRERGHDPDRSAPPPAFAWRPPEGMVLPPAARSRTGEAGRARGRAVEAGQATHERLLARLRAHPALAEGLSGEPAHDRDFGGRWAWMLRFDGFDLGSEDAPGRLLRAKGLDLVETAFDQVEVVEAARPGIRVSDAALAVIAGRGAGMAP